ncbi:nucleotide exchange factor GrpE [Halalkalibacterium halodurans]|uniref:Protein GrpE n=2 Tax=Halalkalibacterium halodurans TaxID=86665 RepID=GRPE_HALH5|nr:nucleotide exchange factor GrpE [Halalkalibacterium halodurans]Q9KD73.1 RecName: Full=Protein GrpE; AltName: Full=HSP-70 cofactor [Halalkalibacterium halodurans C-125]MDY7221871.1 nucleotide exchange factor GrpE [Halalkalibacterium halodurans]MDY7241147.1 nucleotide exchange factor GrpE [Halalkalibacterium halodurans]MED3648174.1 nucleotide exchange factor GrpE [Halalkalibacterium halodurans]MED4080579.1 nucleotide exchange factor GrpE [Halalkalibacterium halodurans]MED4083799.1 nucleotide
MVENEKTSVEETEEKAETEDEMLTEDPSNEDSDEANEEGNELSEEEKRIAELEGQVDELNQRLLRIQADYDNFRRRQREEKEAAAKYRAQSLIEELLPALDNFERALLVEPEQEETKTLLKGMEMVYRQVSEALKKEGLEVIETKGETFDPHLHQAVMQVEDAEFESNEIVEELQKGYKLKDRVIRPSMVKVNA